MLLWAELLRPWSLNLTLAITTIRTELRSRSPLVVKLRRCAGDFFPSSAVHNFLFVLFTMRWLSSHLSDLGYLAGVPFESFLFRSFPIWLENGGCVS